MQRTLFRFIGLLFLRSYRRIQQALPRCRSHATIIVPACPDALFHISGLRAGGVFLLCYGREWWRPARLASLAGTSLLAAATVVLYLKEYLLRTMQTLYPGQRNFSGGALPVGAGSRSSFPPVPLTGHTTR
ncbi:hypothetical protein CBM2633_A100018 [Cupriavidus taiwanensis]|uniref:Uncharacterized protein n=1 Tax=Cupriavidus taiwanensis TaxID=164546 RepID=A0A976AWB5_9BURK|nr:hypothetical protein CBM2615_A280016 [Cupriavidus taiwanensis]SOZ56908.1 hypothetical protein CBM2614_A250017 [Cupriavidus taiwanensis]SOZ59030.1 hypothetical protein CBM2613_A250016 [Cupriavidus taiwanensis]SPA05492.1 hypothetical protein CBM2625_A200017 [Cupriavidus taiwanensis]SPA11754.1 hypothetical protein CBM2633_A100018 [Cupriavidus taiwanensis]